MNTGNGGGNYGCFAGKNGKQWLFSTSEIVCQRRVIYESAPKEPN
ncbi:MAG TPA: hypothetical protein PJ982_06900 [Lacipirellulaceae bacterium]|nr:hypothetical protein [Lacipirellulaceae bacterium]